MHVHDSKVNKNSNNNNSYSRSAANSHNVKNHHNSNKNSQGGGRNSILDRSRQNNDGNSASVMSAYTLTEIDEDHIDDQETINVGNLIIDLESDLEKEKIENEQANAKSTSYSTTNAPSSSSYTPSSFGTKASSSTSSIGNSSNTPTGKTNQKSSSKHSNISINNATTSTNNNKNINSNSNSNSSSSNTINNNNNTNNNSSNNSTINNNTIGSSNVGNNGHLMTTRTVFKSSADERGELKMRITRETKPGKSEHKIVTSPNQKSPTSSSGSSSSNTNNNNLVSQANSCEDNNYNDESISKPSQSSSISSTKECGTSTSIGTITEPECLGPCEPGTSVTLEGIVWQETEGGILVVNVTWRGKTYVGALLDCTKHDWAPPRLCDSPASDIDSKANKGVRPKRVVTRSNGIGLDEKNLLQTTGKLRNGKGRRILTSTDLASCNKRQRESDKSNENIAAQAEANTSLANVSSITDSETVSVPMNVDTAPATINESISTSNISTDKAGPNSPMLISCSEPNCSKKYRNMNGLLYHQAHAHGSENEPNNAQDNSCSSSVIENVNQIDQTNDQVEQKESEEMTTDNCDRQESPIPPEQPKRDQSPEVQIIQGPDRRRRTPSPQLSMKMSNKIASDSFTTTPITINNNSNIAPINHEHRSPIVTRPLEPERRNSSNSNHHGMPQMDHSRRSPGAPPRHLQDHGHHGSSNHHHHHHSSSKSSSSSSSKQQQSNPPPLPATTEEGMKPSGTSTGPPPAPHQANCYFNPAFMANAFPYGLGSYFPRSPLPMYDPLAPPTSSANAAILSRFMNNMRVPAPPESPSRLLSPSMPKNLPFPPGPPMHAPTSQMTHPILPNMPPLTSGSPHLRMPNQVDPMMPPTSQPPYPHSVGLNPMLGLPGPINPMGPIGGPQVPNLVDDPLAKQFPRRFN